MVERRGNFVCVDGDGLYPSWHGILRVYRQGALLEFGAMLLQLERRLHSLLETACALDSSHRCLPP